MSLIRKPAELIVQTSIKVLIYGQPGISKTTVALSSPSPILFDFDNGVHRVNPAHQTDTVQIDSWQNMIDVLNEDLSSYKTIIIDTAGKMLDYLSAFLIKNNPKLGKTNGALSLQGYGERKAEFNNFLKCVAILGKHIVFVAHDKEEKKGEDTIMRPEIGGSSGNDLIKELDLVGYMEAVGKKRTISFNPTERFYAKNTCNLPELIEIPTIINEQGIATAPNNLLTNIFKTYQDNLESRKEMASDYSDLIEVINGKVEAVKDAETANEVATWANSYDSWIWDSKFFASQKLHSKATELGLKFSKEQKQYV